VQEEQRWRAAQEGSSSISAGGAAVARGTRGQRRRSYSTGSGVRLVAQPMWRDEFLSKPMDALSTMDRNPKGMPCRSKDTESESHCRCYYISLCIYI
jgi:hypothetical protein